MKYENMPADHFFNRQSLRLQDHDYSSEGSYFITICTDRHIFHLGAIFNDQMILNETGVIAKNEWYKLPNRFPGIQLGPFCVMPNHVHGIIQINPASASPFPSSTSSISPSPSFLINGLIFVGAGLAPAHTAHAAHASNVENAENAGNVDDADHAHLAITGIRAGASPAPTEIKQSNQEKEGERGKEKVTLGNIVGAYKSLVIKKCLAEHKAKFMAGSEVPLFGKIWQRNYYEHLIRTRESYDKIAGYIVTNPLNWTKDKFFIKFE